MFILSLWRAEARRCIQSAFFPLAPKPVRGSAPRRSNDQAERFAQEVDEEPGIPEGIRCAGGRVRVDGGSGKGADARAGLSQAELAAHEDDAEHDRAA